jgi:Spy/CpxP family protein refolding chaperone
MKILRPGAVAVSFMLVLALSADAQQGRRPGIGMRNEIAREIGIQEYIQNLRLTNAQRDQIKIIVQARRAAILENRQAMMRARLALLKDSSNGPADFGSAQARLMEMRQQILNQIKAQLTSDQLTVLQKRQQKRVDALQQRLDRMQNQGKASGL